MSNKILLAAALGLGTSLGAMPALAQSACMAPIAPAAVDGASVTADQLRAAIADAKNFIAQSDVYQECLGKELDAAKQQAVTDKKKFDQSIADAAMAKADANQKMKEKVGAEANNAIAAYKKAHPAP